MGGTRRITLAAMFIALSMMVAQLPSPGGYLLRFNGFPLILSGLVLGPGGGFLVGAVSDVLSWMSRPGLSFMPFFTLTSGLTGCLPALLLRGRRLTFPYLWLAIWGSQLFIKVCLVCPVRELWFGQPWAITARMALIEQTVHAPLYAWLSLKLLRALERERE